MSLFTFGNYYQENKKVKSPIEWLILEKKDGRMLILSKYALDCRQYHTEYTDVTWETCSLRKWINGEFLCNAFSADEQARIITTTVPADKNPKYGTNTGNATADRVFLLSAAEANRYFDGDESRKCLPTEYAMSNGAHFSSLHFIDGKGTCWWRLRSPGYYADLAVFVSDHGNISYVGDFVSTDRSGVRPAMWIYSED